MICYKLFRVRQDGSIGSLFINRRARLPVGSDGWLNAQPYRTKGFQFRPGWHALMKPEAPHLSMKGRAWYVVEVKDYTLHQRPDSQGGIWALAKKMKILRKA